MTEKKFNVPRVGRLKSTVPNVQSIPREEEDPEPGPTQLVLSDLFMGEHTPATPKAMTTGLVWKPERASLRDKREIVCEVPELLMEILEHDFTQLSESEPEDPIEIRYYHTNARHYHSSGYPMKGAAWAHLQKNPPVIELKQGEDTEYFKPVFDDKYNPYRKNHSATYWAWYVTKWELIPPQEKD